MKGCLTVLPLLTLLASFTYRHTFYASISEFREADNNRITIKIKLFADDLQRAIEYEKGRANFSDNGVVKN